MNTAYLIVTLLVTSAISILALVALSASERRAGRLSSALEQSREDALRLQECVRQLETLFPNDPILRSASAEPVTSSIDPK